MSILDTVALGLAPAHHDPRTIPYAAVSTGGFMPPASYSWMDEHPGLIPTPMYDNDRIGDCVIAARAHHTLRFELEEQGATIPITVTEVRAQYFSESHGVDSGLVYLWSLREWRKGWIAGGRNYDIHSFLAVNYRSRPEVMETMIVGQGVQFGVRLPLNAADQIDAGKPWTVEAGPRSAKGSWGGHAVLADAYDDFGVTFSTWGKRQRASWGWVDAYTDEAYLVIDSVNRVKATGAIDHLALIEAVGGV